MVSIVFYWTHLKDRCFAPPDQTTYEVVHGRLQIGETARLGNRHAPQEGGVLSGGGVVFYG